MVSKHSILRPGFLVTLKTKVTGGVRYARRNLAAPETAAPTSVLETESKEVDEAEDFVTEDDDASEPSEEDIALADEKNQAAARTYANFCVQSVLKPGSVSEDDLVRPYLVTAEGIQAERIARERAARRAAKKPASAPKVKAVSRWVTTRTVEDVAEHEAAIKARGAARSLIMKVCVDTEFGYLCPESRETELFAAIAAARVTAADHNKVATCTHVGVYAITGKIASTDEESARAVGAEVRSLMEAMMAGIDKLDPKAIRAAAEQATAIGAMLAPEQSAKVGAAVAQARKAARDITRRVIKLAEPAAVVLESIQRGAIDTARITFMDLDEPEMAAPDEESLPAVDLGRVAGLDLDDVTGEEPDDGELAAMGGSAGYVNGAAF